MHGVAITTIGGALNGQVWHNRGLNTLPLAKTWLPFGDVPVDNLRLASTAPLPPPPPQQADGGEPDAEAVEAATAAAEAAEAAMPCGARLPRPPSKGHRCLFNIIGNAPDEPVWASTTWHLCGPNPVEFTPGRRVLPFL